MLKDHQKNIFLEERGQALFELILFLPLLLLILTVMVTVGNAINSSINQQKVTRGYYYYTLRGNSLGLNSLDLREYGTGNGMKTVGMYSLGWRRSEPEHSIQDSYATCFKFSTMFSSDNSDKNCDEPNLSGQPKTSIIRLYTAYGLCTEVYTVSNTGVLVPAHALRAQAGLCAMIQ